MLTIAPVRVGGLSARAGLMVRLKDWLALAPAASWMVTLPLAKVPAAVGVPVKLMVVPLSTAVSPVGRPPEEVRVKGPVPPLIARVPAKLPWLTVPSVCDRAPIVGAALTAML